MKYAIDDPKRPLMAVELICQVDGLPMPEPEYRFEPSRRWRFDWAWPPKCTIKGCSGKNCKLNPSVALEIEGGAWTNGRHTRGSGFLNDMEKYNHAVRLGWKIFRCTPTTIHLGMQLVKEALQRDVQPAPRDALPSGRLVRSV